MNTKRSLFTSCVSLLLCLVMFLGTTFAWFTDVVESKGNKIQAGTLQLDLSLLDKDNGQWRSIKDSKQPIFNYKKWEPGYTDVKILKVENKGSLSLKWVARFASENGVSALAEVIDVYVCPGVAEVYPTDRQLDSTWKKVGTLDKFIDRISDTTYGFLDAGESATLGIALKMQETADNDYQGLTLGEFDIRIVATQASKEEDSFDNQYDADATFPDEINFETSASLDQVQTIYGELTQDFIIRYSDSIYALLPAGTKLADGIDSLSFSGKSVANGSNITLGEGDSAYSYDIHIEGVADDNTKPITVYLGAIFEKGISDTSLKLYHEDALMTRVNSVSDFAINNQFFYDSATGEVVLYVDNFSVFSALNTSADEWDGKSDTAWYNENDTEFTLTTAEQLAGFRDLVDRGNTFAGKTVTLGKDIDLVRKPFDPIGFGYYNAETNTRVFMGIFDGGNHTIYNLYENCWELDPDKVNYGTYTYSTAGAGLFASIKDATIKNLAVSGAEIVFECVDMGVVVGYAQGTCHFENIVVTDSKIANYNRYTGGVVGEVSYGPYGIDTSLGYSHTFKNITVDSSVTVSGLWGSFGCGMGGVIGGKWGDATVKMENVVSAPVMDVYNDVVSAYQWYAFRGCGMLIGHTEEPYSDGRHSGNATASFLTCENVKVYYGDWVEYHYYEFENQDNATGQRYPWVRAEAGEYCDAFSNIRYGIPTHSGIPVTASNADEYDTDKVTIVFDQLYGADRGMYGTAEHEGVTVFKKNVKTVYIHNNSEWTSLKLDYWYKHGEETWTNVANGIDISDKAIENNIYKLEIPVYADGFKISGDGDKEATFRMIDVANNGFYTLEGTHEHSFDADGNCICGCKKVTVNILNYATENGWVNTKQYTSIVMNSDISITASSGGNNAKYYTSSGNNWRIYQSDSGTFTINSKNGNILSVKITYDIDNTGILTLNKVGIESGTVVDVNNTSVTFGVGNTTAATNGQVRITDIEVIYSTVLACSHSSIITETMNPTCTAAGYTAEKCAECGKVMSMVEGEPATGHSYNSEITKDPTCTDKGSKTYTCEICQASYTENISATGHVNTSAETVDASCTDDGSVTITCNDCGEIVSTEVIDATGHSYVDGICDTCGAEEPSEPETPNTNRYYIATIRTSGNYFYMTSNLGTASTKRYQAVDSKLTALPSSISNPEDGYVFVLIDNGDGTYSIQAEGVEGNNYLGWTSGNSGTLVGENDALKLTVDINDGKYNIHFTDSDAERYLALNGTSGNEYFAWYKSGQKQNLILIPVVDNSGSEGEETPCEHSNTTETTTATCTEAGDTTITCDDCGETVSTEKTAALGHTTENGTCERCGEEIGSTTEPELTQKTYSYTFTSKQYSANGTQTLGEINWTLSGNGGYWGYDGTKGQQFGSGNNPYKSLSLTSAELTNVSQITINTSGASSVKATLNVYVGETLVETISITSSATNYIIDVTNLSGEVKFEYVQTSSKALYIKSISVNYAE